MKGVFAALAITLTNVAAAHADPAPPGPGERQQQAGLAVGIGGLVLDGIGIYLATRASADADEVSQYRGEWTATQHATERAGQRAAAWSVVSLAAGTAALATGIAVYYLGARTHGASVAMTPSSAELAWSVSF